MNAVEVNFDGLVGPTHNYSGLSYGNVASLTNAAAVSNPREAALQGLHKMRTLRGLGIPQAVLPPQERPAVDVLRRLGFSGSDQQVIERARRQAPQIFTACCSASSMWTANAATVSPSADTADGRVHFTPANLVNKFHRSIEAETTARLLRAIFADPRYFDHHAPLPAVDHFADEGAANHTRLCTDFGQPGIELFVYGKVVFNPGPAPTRYPARHTLEASQAIAWLHGLDPESTVFAQQNPAVIDAGVFHNDVIAVGNRNVLFYHERAFADHDETITQIRRGFGDAPFYPIAVADAQIGLAEAVASYLFNSQLVSLPDSADMALILPQECRETPVVRDYLQALVEMDNPIRHLQVLDLRQSMQNGGGPACLRLRVVLNEAELAAVKPGVLFDDDLFATLSAWVKKHYRDRLTESDLADPRLLEESRNALDELTGILQLGAVYPFQGAG